MKITRLLAVIPLLLLLLGASCGQRKVRLAATAPDSPKRVYSKVHGAALIVPSDWQETFRDGNPFMFAVAPGAGPLGPMVNVVEEPISQRLNPYDYLQANLYTMQLSLPGMEVVRSGLELKDGISMAWIQYTYPRGKEKVEALSYAQTRDYMAWVVTAVCPQAKYKKQEPLLRYICQSLRIDPGR